MWKEGLPIHLCGKLFSWKKGIIIAGTALLLQSPVWAQYAPNKPITLHVEEQPLAAVLKQIEKQAGIRFVYDGNTREKMHKVTLHITAQPLEKTLQQILKEHQLAYTVAGNQVILKAGDDPQVIQQWLVNGRVAILEGGKNTYLPGITVREKKSGRVTLTDVDGRYSILLSEGGNSAIVFTYVGYKPQEVKVNGRHEINLSLEESAEALKEVVVTGYQTLKRVNTTGSFATITAAELEQRNSISLNRILEGTVAGLSLYKNDVQIRGGSSLFAGTRPLFVVDGFEVANLPENLNDIENITVLKDAAAAAIWGARAANGVVVVTTKRGKEGKLRVDYAANLYLTSKPDYNQLHRADATALIDYEKEGYDKEYIKQYMFDGGKYGYSQSYDAFLEYDRGNITLEERDARLNALSKLSNKKQVNDYLLRTGVRQNHYLSLSGGSDKFQFFVSGSYDKSGSQYVSDKSENMALNSRTTYQVIPRLKLRTDISAIYNNQQPGYDVAGAIYNMWPYQQLLDSKGDYVYDYSSFNKIENDRLVKEGYYDNGVNILEESRLTNNRVSNFGLRTRFGLDLNILKGLDLTADFQYEKNSQTGKNFTDPQSADARQLINQFTTQEFDPITNTLKNIYNLPRGTIFDQSQAYNNNFAVRGQLNYSRYFNERVHYVNIIGGAEVKKFVAESNTQRKMGYNDDLLSWQYLNAEKLAKGIEWWDGTRYTYDVTGYDRFGFSDNREASFYSSAVYTYKERYTASGSFRIDQSNLFGTDPKYKRTPLWSTGLSWNISNESFFQSGVVSNLVLRGTYGLTGNFDRETSPFLIASRFYNNVVQDYISSISTPPNPKLRWERTRTANIGLDVALLKGRISASVEGYFKRSYDLLGQIVMDGTNGFSSGRINAADLRNNGIETSINAYIIQTRHFSWQTTLNLAYNDNKITKNNVTDSDPVIGRVLPSSGIGSQRFVEGYAREGLWSYIWAGLDEKGGPLTYDEKGEKINTPVFASLVYSGNVRPMYTGGWSNTFSYKGLQASFFLVFNAGHVFRREYPSMNPWDTNPQTNELIADRWRKPGDETRTDVAGIPFMEDFTDSRERMVKYSSNSVLNGGFVRLREIQLSYGLPASILKQTPLRALSITAQANNIHIWTKNKYHLDPEAIDPVAGTYNLTEPTVFTFGLRASF